MSYYDYDFLKNEKVAFGWLDITDEIKDPTMLALTKNITEYWIQELSEYKVHLKFKKSIDELLQWASEEDINYLVINATGSSLSDCASPMIQMVAKYISENSNISVVGHILDKKDRYYEIHHQSMLISMNWWKSAGRPFFGEESNQEITATAPLRSEENHHDEYTPLWASQGTETKIFSGTRQGWNLIKTALETSERVYSWPKYLRLSKCYLYPEVTTGAPEKISNIFNKLQLFTHFVANTESTPDIRLNEWGGKFDVVISPASGITPLLSAWKCGLVPRDRIKIYDISPIALEIQKSMKDESIDYKNFESSFYNMINKKLNSFGHEMLCATDNVARMQEIINSLLPQGLEDFINNIWPHLEVSYTRIDMFGENAANILNGINKTDRTYLHLTNIFHYQNTAWLLDAKKRYAAHKKLMLDLSKINMDALYVRCMDYQTKIVNLDNLPKFKEKEVLKEIPWYTQN